jgi:hypothetical protein
VERGQGQRTGNSGIVTEKQETGEGDQGKGINGDKGKVTGSRETEDMNSGIRPKNRGHEGGG